MDDPEAALSPIEAPFEGVTAEALAGALTGAVTDGLIGACMGATAPFLGRAVSLAGQEIRNGFRRRMAMFGAASEVLGNGLDDALRRAEDDADLVHLMHAAGDAAERTRSLKKLVALGEAVARGLSAETQDALDYEQLLVEAMDGMERPHLRLLAAMVDIEDDGALKFLRPKSLDWGKIRLAAGNNRPAVVKLIADLQAGALIIGETVVFDGGDAGGVTTAYVDAAGSSRSPFTRMAWQASEFGLDVFSRFWSVGLRYGQDPVSALDY